MVIQSFFFARFCRCHVPICALGLPPVNVGILEVEVFTGTAFRTSSLVASIDLVVGQPAYGRPPFLFLIALFVEP